MSIFRCVFLSLSLVPRSSSFQGRHIQSPLFIVLSFGCTSESYQYYVFPSHLFIQLWSKSYFVFHGAVVSFEFKSKRYKYSIFLSHLLSASLLRPLFIHIWPKRYFSSHGALTFYGFISPILCFIVSFMACFASVLTIYIYVGEEVFCIARNCSPKF